MTNFFALQGAVLLEPLEMQPEKHCRWCRVNSIGRWTPINQVCAAFQINCRALAWPKSHGVRHRVG